MVDETLSAAIEIRDRATDDLQSIAASFESVAESALDAAEGALVAAEGFDEAEDEASSLNRSLRSVAGGSVVAGGSLQAVGGAAEAASEGIDNAEDETQSLANALFATVPAAAAATASLTAFDAAASGMDIGDLGEGIEGPDVSSFMPEGMDDAQDEVSALQSSLDIFGSTDVEARTGLEGSDEVDQSLARRRRLLDEFEQRRIEPFARSGLGDAEDEARKFILQTEDDEKLDSIQQRLSDIQDVDVDLGLDEEERSAQRIVRRIEESERRGGFNLGTEEMNARRYIQRADNVQERLQSIEVPDLDDSQSTLRDYRDMDVSASGDVDFDADSDQVQREMSAAFSMPDLPRWMKNPLQTIQDNMRGRDVDVPSQFSTGRVMDMALSLDPEASEIDDDEVRAVQRQVQTVGEDILSLPSITMDVEDEEDFERFGAELENVGDIGGDILRTFEQMEDADADAIVEQADSAETLRRNFESTDYETQRMQRTLANLGDTQTDLVGHMLAAANSTDEFDGQVSELGEKAMYAGAGIQGLQGPMKSHIANMAIGEERTDEFGDELSEMGNEAIAARLKVAAMDSTMGNLQSTLGDTQTRIGPFTTSLAGLAQLMPAIISGATVLGGALTTAGAGLAGLAGIFAGGALAAGEDRANQMEATASATEDATGTMSDLEEASSDAERSMIGLQEIMADVRDAAYEAMAPLRQPQFADFFMQGLDQVIKLLGEFAEVAAWGADALMETVEVLASTWWSTYPSFMDELVNLMAVFGPYLEGIAVRGIEAIPTIFAAMADHGRILMPLLMDFGNALVDLLPMLLELGTLILRGILPNLTGFVRGLNEISPQVILLARALGDALAIVDPFIEELFRLGGAAMVLTSVIPFLTWSLRGLRLITSVLVLRPILGLFSTLGMLLTKVGSAVLWLKAAFNVLSLSKLYALVSGGILNGLAYLTAMILNAGAAVRAFTVSLWGLAVANPISAIILALGVIIAGLLTYFDKWDEAISMVVMAFNGLIKILSLFGTFIYNAVVGAMNLAISVMDEMIDRYNRWAKVLPGIQTIGVEFEEYDTMDYSDAGEGAYLGENAGQGAASFLNNPSLSGGMSMVPNPSGNPQFSDDGSYSGYGTDRTGRPGGNRPWDDASGGTNVTNNFYGQQDEEQIQNAVRRAVETENRRTRRSNTSGN